MRKVYVSPASSPVTVYVVLELPVDSHVDPPSEEYSYLTTTSSSVSLGELHVRIAVSLTLSTLRPPGVPGASISGLTVRAREAFPGCAPVETALTLKVYEIPFVSPVTVMGTKVELPAGAQAPPF
jgi:hypothetical protein